MLSFTVYSLLGALLAGGDADLAAAMRKEKASLQGVWKVTASVDNGQKVPVKDLKDLYIIFRGDAILIREAGASSVKFTYSLQPRKQPKEIDLTFVVKPNQGREDRGIYLLEGDRLTICIQANKDAPRPRQFASLPGSNLWLIVLQRTKE